MNEHDVDDGRRIIRAEACERVVLTVRRRKQELVVASSGGRTSNDELVPRVDKAVVGRSTVCGELLEQALFVAMSCKRLVALFLRGRIQIAEQDDERVSRFLSIELVRHADDEFRGFRSRLDSFVVPMRVQRPNVFFRLLGPKVDDRDHPGLSGVPIF